MKCETCQSEMCCVDDARFEGGSGFDSYICPVCLTELTVTTKGNTRSTTLITKRNYLARTEDEVKAIYRDTYLYKKPRRRIDV